MTPLRQRYSEDLRLRNKSPRTIETYVLRVALKNVVDIEQKIGYAIL